MDDRIKKLLILMGIIVGGLIIISLLIFVFRDKSLTYTEIENKMVSASKEYLNDNKDLMPLNDEDEVIVDSSTLSSQDYMKALSDYQKDKSVSCSGAVYVTKSGDYYNYAPYLNCGDKYTTKYLYEELISKVVSKDDGLYKVDQYSRDKGTASVYIYRGDYVDNYVKIDGNLWRIVKVDENNTIQLIQDYYDKNTSYRGVWDDRYNTDKKENLGINDYYKSIIRRELNQYYQSDALSSDIKAKLVSKDLCIGTRKVSDSKNDGSIECKTVMEGEYLGLLPVYDFLNASLDSNCKKTTNKSCSNYNYLTDYGRSFWMITIDADTTYKAYKATTTVSTANLSSTSTARIVINITKNTVYVGGSGTYNDPYLIR